jgi:hypothetical protein
VTPQLPQPPMGSRTLSATSAATAHPASTDAQQDPSSRRRGARLTAALAVLICTAAALVATLTPSSAASTAPLASYVATVDVHDAMSRTVTSGLGTANTGGTWAMTSPTKFSVTPSSGHVAAITRGTNVRASLPGDKMDEQLLLAFSLPALPTSGTGMFIAIEFRRHLSGAVYRARLQIAPGGVMTLGFSRFRDNVLTHVGSTFVLNTRAIAGHSIMLEGLAAGTTAIQFRSRAWLSGTTKPDWQLGASDASSSRFLSGGRSGIYISSDANTLSSRVTLEAFDGSSLAVNDPLPSPTTAPPTTAPPTTAPPTTAPPTTAPPTTPSPTQPSGPAARPGPTNTGVTPGTHLTRRDGNLIITTAGATYNGLDIHGFVTVRAPNVTITNSIIRGGVESATNVGIVTNVSTNGTNFVLTDSELVPEFPSVYIDGIKGWNYTLNRVNIHGTVDTAKVFGDNATIENSWLHDTVYYDHDPYQGGGHTHNDGVQVLSGTNIHIQHNTITGAYNAAMQVTQGHGAVNGLWFTGNWADGGGCTVNLNNSPMPTMGPVTVSDNRFGHDTRNANCPIIATQATQLTATGNVWDDTGAPVAVRNGG